MTYGTLDYRRLAELHRPQAAPDFARAARALAARGLLPRDISQALRLSTAAVLQLLDHHRPQEDTMKSHPHSSAPALAGGPNDEARAERDAAQARHAADAARNVLKSRQPGAIFTPDEAETLANSKGAAR